MTRLLRDSATTPAPRVLSYPEVGATATAPLPGSYHHLHHMVRVGHGRDVFEAAGGAVLTWQMHRRSGVRIDTGVERAEPGATLEVSLGLGPLRVAAPCEVVWIAYEGNRIGFAYGTRTGHPECGEESFVVDLMEDGSVWFTVTAFSRPAAWYTRLAGPLVPVFQHAYARHLGRTLTRIATR
ncbi:DUF1990 family protein [Streptomyces purpureus]|uniref:DUF1990 domain-containing protein n=1 Tax=Streptomyces purpureus TaxID=1951 RepID=A0A918LLS4_9ACTN|nr:DUF1990 domain-containing protein [Streptomyces purpureus]GGT13134.1 DUF1990 domain-containing protein [Streptomyces purpureus]